MIEIINKLSCTGCGVCVSICPKKCIELIGDEEGFLYPSVNKNKCINCNLCKKVCHLRGGKCHMEHPQIIYAYANENNIRLKSTSGGFFTAISDWVLRQNGIIYGAVFDNEFTVIHSRATSGFERDKQRYSKYVQSKMYSIIEEVKDDLINDINVLFSGTPCQVAGILSYLDKQKVPLDKLITCDFICHGVSSPVIWNDYLNYVRSKYNDQIVNVNFRSKDIGWHTPQLKIEMLGHTQALTEKQDAFYQLFYSNCILRPSCHDCLYANRKRVSDFTMADCWGIEKTRPELDDNMGLSLVFANSKKALSISKFLGLNIELSFENINQPHLSKPAALSKQRDKFWTDYKNKGGKYVIEKYGNIKLYRKILKRTKKMICKIIGR